MHSLCRVKLFAMLYRMMAVCMWCVHGKCHQMRSQSSVLPNRFCISVVDALSACKGSAIKASAFVSVSQYNNGFLWVQPEEA